VAKASPTRRKPVERRVRRVRIEQIAALRAPATPNDAAYAIDADTIVNLTANDTFCYHRTYSRFL
jgi:hypothetical protein